MLLIFIKLLCCGWRRWVLQPYRHVLSILHSFPPLRVNGVRSNHIDHVKGIIEIWLSSQKLKFIYMSICSYLHCSINFRIDLNAASKLLTAKPPFSIDQLLLTWAAIDEVHVWHSYSTLDFKSRALSLAGKSYWGWLIYQSHASGWTEVQLHWCICQRSTTYSVASQFGSIMHCASINPRRVGYQERWIVGCDQTTDTSSTDRRPPGTVSNLFTRISPRSFVRHSQNSSVKRFCKPCNRSQQCSYLKRGSRGCWCSISNHTQRWIRLWLCDSRIDPNILAWTQFAATCRHWFCFWDIRGSKSRGCRRSGAYVIGGYH